MHSWKYKDPFIIKRSVLESDIDSYNHVNNTVYHRWLDECARSHSTKLGIDPEDAMDFGLGMAVLKSEVEFLAPALLGQEIDIATWIVTNDKRLKTRSRI